MPLLAASPSTTTTGGASVVERVTRSFSAVGVDLNTHDAPSGTAKGLTDSATDTNATASDHDAPFINGHVARPLIGQRVACGRLAEDASPGMHNSTLEGNRPELSNAALLPRVQSDPSAAWCMYVDRVQIALQSRANTAAVCYQTASVRSACVAPDVERPVAAAQCCGGIHIYESLRTACNGSQSVALSTTLLARPSVSISRPWRRRKPVPQVSTLKSWMPFAPRAAS